MVKEKQQIRYWNKVAADYCSRQDKLTSIYQPVVDELLGDVSGKRVLDAGCGDGMYSRKLASRGAIVTGIDGSSKMISIAKGRSTKINVDYKIVDLTKKLPFPDGYYDVVLANMVLMDIPRIDVTVSEFARLLSNKGFLLLSITHPCFFCSGWVTDKKGQNLHKEISDYLTPKVEELNFWGKTLHFHRPLSHYFDVLTQSGFCVDVFKEPVPSEEALKEHPSWEFHRRVPSFVVIRAMLKS
jgi:2-polyprenyl-3-methyl-5-hydroxy-6-metoxy-1,4-benzoquinol methylase